MRLIDADKFYESFEYENCAGCQYFSSPDCEYCNVNGFLVAIDSRPRVDAIPVVHGHWIHDNIPSIQCSKCCYKYDEPTVDFIYCPRCGARMDGDK